MSGWIGSTMLALCGFPQALKSSQDKNSDGLSVAFLLLWTFGEIFTLAAISTDAPDLKYLLMNYLCNLGFLAVIWKYKLYPVRSV